MFWRVLVFLLALPLVAEAGVKTVDFSHYDEPLYAQVVDRIKAKILARLGEGRNTRDRFFIIPFAFRNRGNDPAFSHSFISVIRVLADAEQPKLTPGLEKRTEANRNFQAYTISWLPRDFQTNPNLCVFEGAGSRLFPHLNTCLALPGRNFTLEETLQFAVADRSAVAMWGPYEIRKEGFDLGVRRKQLLDGGTILYRADDRLYRKKNVAINCFHAMAGLGDLYPNGGLFGTGFMMWGFNGTARVMIEYTERARYKGLLLEPVDVKNDRYGYVFAPSRESDAPYVPIRFASAYRQ